MTRVKKEERRFFYSWEKKEILSKTKGRCAHCGKKIVIGDNFTIEHVIPLSKGGDNDLSNLVGLCNKCNREKGSHIVDPIEYYKYINTKVLDSMVKNYKEYCKNVSWFSPTSLFQEDQFQIESEYPILKRTRVSGHILSYRAKTLFMKACYADLDGIYHFLKDYYAKRNYNMPYLKEVITEYYMNGCIYFSKNKHDEFNVVLLFRISSTLLSTLDHRYYYLDVKMHVNTTPEKNEIWDIGFTTHLSDLIRGLILRICGDLNKDIGSLYTLVISRLSGDKALDKTYEFLRTVGGESSILDNAFRELINFKKEEPDWENCKTYCGNDKLFQEVYKDKNKYMLLWEQTAKDPSTFKGYLEEGSKFLENSMSKWVRPKLVTGLKEKGVNSYEEI